jgi:hypothetical protein
MIVTNDEDIEQGIAIDLEGVPPPIMVRGGVQLSRLYRRLVLADEGAVDRTASCDEQRENRYAC